MRMIFASAAAILLSFSVYAQHDNGHGNMPAAASDAN